MCTSTPTSICAHGHIPVCLQAITLSSAIPAQASTGTGRVQGMEQDSGSSEQLPPWQVSRKSSSNSPGRSGKSVPLSPGYSSPVHPQALGQASCPWPPACGGCPSSAPTLGVPASLSVQASRAAKDGTTSSAGQHLCPSQAVLGLLHISAHQLVVNNTQSEKLSEPQCVLSAQTICHCCTHCPCSLL